MPERTFETVGPARDPTGRGDKGALIFLVDDYLGKFSLDIFRVRRLASETDERFTGFLDSAALHKVPGRVR
jgi:hypothetical protein